MVDTNFLCRSPKSGTTLVNFLTSTSLLSSFTCLSSLIRNPLPNFLREITFLLVKQIISFIDKLHCGDKLFGGKIGYNFDFLSPNIKLNFDKMQINIVNLNIFEKILNNLMIFMDDNKTDLFEKESTLSIIEKLERTLHKFTFKQLNETTMNYRNILLQNIFKLIGTIRDKFESVKLRSRTIEFYNEELHNQDNIDNYSYKKTLDLKSLLNMSVCLNGGLNRIHEQG